MASDDRNASPLGLGNLTIFEIFLNMSNSVVASLGSLFPGDPSEDESYLPSNISKENRMMYIFLFFLILLATWYALYD